MSNLFVSSLDFATSKIYVYMGIPTIIFGLSGGILNTIVFLSLRVYRESSSAFYLTVVSFVNIIQLLTGVLSRVLVSTTDADWTELLPIPCKLRSTIFQLCSIVSPTCLCLVTIDQYLSTSSRPQWQRWSNIKIAYRLTIFCIIFWFFYGIPYIIYYNPIVSSSTGSITCVMTNIVYQQYYSNIHAPLLICGIPLSITTIFGYLASRNFRGLAHQRIPLGRRRHEIQLTTMVLFQIIFNAILTPPVYVVRALQANFIFTQTPNSAAQMRFAVGLTTCIYYLYYAIPFYVYICVSERFRKQLRYVLIGICLNRWQKVRANQVLPQMQIPEEN